MACKHNQVKIDELNELINQKQKDIINLEGNITKCKDIEKKHVAFFKAIVCVKTELQKGENTIVAGKPYDNGKMDECKDKANNTINNCETIINESIRKKLILEREILNLEKQVAALDFICELCIEDN